MSSIISIADKEYPKPMYSHEQVLKTPALFWDSLRSLHSELSTKYLVPIIGGIELDLHALYTEVTNKGGYNKVDSERKWSEISSVLGFSPTKISSHALKSYYHHLLFNFEQLYFFKLQGLLTPTVPLTFEVTGTIEAETNNGYLVSVKLGTETSYGEIYHQDQPNSSESTRTSNVVVPNNPNDTCKKRERKINREEDRDRPKPTRSGYNFYFAKKFSKLNGRDPVKGKEIAKMIGESWMNLSQDNKNVYNEQGKRDKERYHKELREQKEKMKNRDESNNKFGQKFMLEADTEVSRR